MKIKFVTALVALFTLGFSHPALAEIDLSEMIEIDRLCFRFPTNDICKEKESYISLEKWENNKTVCSLATELDNQEKKCKVVVGDRELIIYIEQGIVSESLSNTLKTKAIKIPLDNIFAFDTQWWLANSEGNNFSKDNVIGVFPYIQVGFITASNSLQYPNSEFLTISGKHLHQIMEKMESWRYYLPDLTVFEEHLKSQTSASNSNLDISKNIKKLKETNECSRCDLRSADLTEMNLEGANLEGAI